MYRCRSCSVQDLHDGVVAVELVGLAGNGLESAVNRGFPVVFCDGDLTELLVFCAAFFEGCNSLIDGGDRLVSWPLAAVASMMYAL